MKRALILACAAILAGCSSGEQQDIREWMDEQAKGMRGAQNAIPGLSAGSGVGAGVQASLTGGYSWVVQKFQYTVPSK